MVQFDKNQWQIFIKTPNLYDLRKKDVLLRPTKYQL